MCQATPPLIIVTSVSSVSALSRKVASFAVSHIYERVLAPVAKRHVDLNIVWKVGGQLLKHRRTETNETNEALPKSA